MQLLVRTRIAPTPSGLLHRGNAYNFLFAALLVKRGGGDLRLRIDDLDTPRMRPGYVQDIFDTLGWLGIRPDSGPRNVQEQQAVFSQQLRIPHYQEYLDRLVKTGRVFACTCSRKDIATQSRNGQYPGTCRFKHLPLDMPEAAWRLLTPENIVISFEDSLIGNVSVNLFEQMRDFVVRRRDGIPAYHIASLADDACYRINTIIRGRDLLSGTAAQLYLAELLAIEDFKQAMFYHHPLIENATGDKLSKSAGSTSVRAVRESGTPVVKFQEDFLKWLTDEVGYTG